jgi:hypothetical protein
MAWFLCIVVKSSEPGSSTFVILQKSAGVNARF